MQRLSIFLVTLCLSFNLFAGGGLVRVKSNNSAGETLDRYEAAVRARGMTVFARIDHSAGAAGVDLALAPNQVLIFGNPKVGTLLMQSQASTGIDLPMKALAYTDGQGETWLLYNDPAYLAARHNIHDRNAVVTKMQKALAGFAEEATR